MSLIFSKSCEYGTQAVLFLARESENGPILLRDISGALAIPHHFLSKILQALVLEGIVVSQKGFNGGFSLGRPARQIALIDIVRAIDGDEFLDQCVLGFPGCNEKTPCPVHPTWKRAKSIIVEILHKKTISELSKELDPKLELLAKI